MYKKLLFLFFVFLILIAIPKTTGAEINPSITPFTPQFLTASKARGIFSNPADLTYFDYMVGGNLTYSITDQKASGSILIHYPDWGLGDFAWGIELFGPTFSQDLMWVDDNQGGHFTLAKGGYTQNFIWAVSYSYLRLGASLKYYYYRELDTNINERGLGFDAGMYLTPFPELLLGIYSTDIGNTKITDADQPSVTQRTITNRTWITASLLSKNDLYLSAGVPTDLLKAYSNARDLWKKCSFSLKKIFNQAIIAEGGYNGKDIYAGLGIKFNEYFSIEYLASNDVYVSDGIYRHLVTCTYGIPMPKAVLDKKAEKKSTPEIVIGRPYNPWIDVPFWWMGMRDKKNSIVVTLKHRKASSLLGSAEYMLSPEGRAQANDNANTLIITDFENNAQRIENAVLSADKETQ